MAVGKSLMAGLSTVFCALLMAAGLAWQPTRRLAIVGEYRHTSFDVDFDTTNSLFFPTMNGTVDTTVRSDRLLFGISHRFGADAPKKEAQP